MRRMTMCTAAVFVGALALTMPPAAAAQQFDLAAQLASNKLRAVNREATPLTDGARRGVHVSEQEGNGVIWVDGAALAQGTIEVDVRGRDTPQRSFVGIAFHGTDDKTYEAVYIRPFNFRNPDTARQQNAVQYISLPDYDWPRLRKEFPSEFENPVDASVVPTDWVPLKIVVKDKTVQIFVGPTKTPALEVRKLGTLEKGAVGLWVGNNSDGDFANLRITPAK